MSFLDRFKNSEFPTVRHHATMAEQEFKAAIIISNDCLPKELQTHDAFEMEDREEFAYNRETNEGGKFYGTDLLTIERRLAKNEVVESEHVKAKNTKESRLDAYAAQWDHEAAADVPQSLDYIEDEAKFHQNAVLFLKLVLTHEEFQDFEEECEEAIQA